MSIICNAFLVSSNEPDAINWKNDAGEVKKTLTYFIKGFQQDNVAFIFSISS